MIELPTEDEPVRVVQGDCRISLTNLPNECFASIISSPPYWGGLRDYGDETQIGLERDPVAYVDALSGVFGEARRTLADDGTLWLNIGDVYAASGKGGGGSAGKRKCWSTIIERKGFRMPPPGYKMKDLTLAPFQVADRLRRDGWYLRQTIIWAKAGAVEPSRLDRPAISHEYLFLFAKSERYAARDPGESWWNSTVWNIPIAGDPSHPAVMPKELVRRCIVASTKPGDMVLDPFGGSGTVGGEAVRQGRRAVVLELNPDYAKACQAKADTVMGRTGLFAVA